MVFRSRKKTTRPRRRRRPANKTNRRYAKLTRVRAPGGIADRLYLKMKYHETSSLTSSAGVPASYIFRTSLNDPNLTASGHYPMGRNQWSAFYNQYRIYGIGYKVTAYNTSAADVANFTVIQKPNATAVVSIDQQWETQYAKTKQCGLFGSGTSSKIISGYMSTAKICGITKQRLSNDDIFSALFTANPVSMAYLHIYGSPADGAGSLTLQLNVQLMFYVQMFDRHTLLTST